MMNNKKILGLLALTSGSAAFAEFDSSGFVTTLTTGAGTAGTVAGVMAAILAGVLVWKKVAKYFNKAG